MCAVRPQLRATHGVQQRTMKQLIALLIAMVHVPSLTTMAAAQTTDVNTQLKDVIDKIRTKRVAWKTPEAELAPELEELDAIYLQHKGENPEDLANVLRLKATVYWSIVDNSEKGIAVIRQLKKEIGRASCRERV